MPITRWMSAFAVASAGAAYAEDGQDPSQDPCVIAAQKASLGVYRSLEQRRLAGYAFEIEVEEWVERNQWEDPGALILRFFRTEAAAEPYIVIRETLTEDGMGIVIDDADGRRSIDFPFRYDCEVDAETGAYRFDMYYEQMRDGAPHDHVNQIEGDRRSFSLVRLARPTGSDAPYRWIATLTARRPDAPDE